MPGSDHSSPKPGAVAELLALSDERDQWMWRLLAAERAAYEAGRAAGYRQGYERGARLRETEWPAVIAPLTGPTHEELEALRWGPGGRAAFGAPRPADRFPQKPLEAAS